MTTLVAGSAGFIGFHVTRALLERGVGYKPATPVKQGVANFVAWYRDYYKGRMQTLNATSSLDG